jgi:hypothetical protein
MGDSPTAAVMAGIMYQTANLAHWRSGYDAQSAARHAARIERANTRALIPEIYDASGRLKSVATLARDARRAKLKRERVAPGPCHKHWGYPYWRCLSVR